MKLSEPVNQLQYSETAQLIPKKEKILDTNISPEKEDRPTKSRKGREIITIESIELSDKQRISPTQQMKKREKIKQIMKLEQFSVD